MMLTEVALLGSYTVKFNTTGIDGGSPEFTVAIVVKGRPQSPQNYLEVARHYWGSEQWRKWL